MTSPAEPLVQIQNNKRIVLHDAFYQNSTNGSTPPNKGAARALNKKCLLMTFPPESLVQIQNNFIEMFLMMSSTKFAQTVSLRRKRDIDKKYLQIKSPEPLVQIQNNFTEMVLMLPSTKIEQLSRRFSLAEQHGYQS